MEGVTIKEMAEMLKISTRAVLQRLIRAKIKPITMDALYDPAVIDRIREVSKGGRPRKEKGENNDH
jgi:hypothetical protein